MTQSISHELNTPLNGIHNLLSCLMLNNDVDQEIKDIYIQPAVNCGTLMNSMISDILDFTKAKLSIFKMKYAPVNIRKLLADIVQIMQISADSRKIDLTVDISDDVPETIETEKKKLKQILLSLTGNALKYTFSGKITIKVKEVQCMR